jgi:hypothetical protein
MKKLSKANLTRLEKGLPIIPSEEVEQANIVAYLELLKNS